MAPTPKAGRPKDRNQSSGCSRSGSGDPGVDEFQPLPDGTAVPLKKSEVNELTEWDFAHFEGTDGTGGGGHSHNSTRPNATKFGLAVETLEDLQAVQDSALHNNALSRFDEQSRTYVLRGLSTARGGNVIVDVVVDPYGDPVTLYPVNGDFVTRNGANGRDAGPVPLDSAYLAAWIVRR